MDSLPKSKTFEDVELWKKAHAWVLEVYRFTEGFPKHEMFGLTSMLTGDPTSFTVTAQEDTLLYRMAEETIRPFLTAPEALGFVVRSLAGRVEVRRRPPEELRAFPGEAPDPGRCC